MENFAKVLEYENQNVDLTRDIAQMAKLAGQIDYAIKFYEKAVELDCYDEVGYNNLGRLHEKKQEYEIAKECYIKSLKIRENYETAFDKSLNDELATMGEEE